MLKLMYRLELPDNPPSLNKFYSSPHWSIRKRLADDWHSRFSWALRAAAVPPLPGLILTATLFSPRPLDSDNCIMAAKFLLDAMQALRLIKNDNPAFVPSIILQSRKGKEKKTVILIEPLDVKAGMDKKTKKEENSKKEIDG